MPSFVFHNNYHRGSHYTIPQSGYPASGTDPIASDRFPFMSIFYNRLFDEGKSVFEYLENGFKNFQYVIENGSELAPKTKPNGNLFENPQYQQVADLIRKNKRFIQNNVISFVRKEYPTVLVTSQLSSKCFRDTAYIVDSIVADIENNANHRSVETGIFYFSGAVLNVFNVGSRIPTLPENQIDVTIKAITGIGDIITGIDLPITSSYTNKGILSSKEFWTNGQNDMMSAFDLFASIVSDINNTPKTTPSGVIPYPNYIDAANTIKGSRGLLQQRVVDFIQANYPTALIGNTPSVSQGLSSKCFRDTGFIIDAMVADILNNANHRSIETGLFYFSGAVLGALNTGSEVPTLPTAQVDATINAISAIGSYITGLSILGDSGYIRTPILVENLYFTNSQNKLISSFANFTNIISNSANIPKTSPNGIVNDPSYKKASDLIKIAREDLRLQTVKYVKTNFPFALSADTLSGSEALSAKCFRDSGYIIDSIAADLENNANHRSVETGSFYFSGAVLARDRNYDSIIPTLPADQVEATIQAISAIGKYITGRDIPLSPPSFTIDGVLFRGSGGEDRVGDVLKLVETMIYPLQTSGANVSYSPEGSPTPEDIDLGSLLLTERLNVQKTLSAYVFSKNYLSSTSYLSSISAELTEKCNRDVGYMIDAVANDLITGVDAKSIQYAIAYWDGSTSRIPSDFIPDQRNNTLDTIEKIKTTVLDIDVTRSSNPQNNILKKIKKLTQTVVYPLEHEGGILEYEPKPILPPSENVSIANVLLSNRENIQDKVDNYVRRQSYLSIPELFDKCKRDVGFMVDAVANDLINNTNAKSIQYAVAYWDGNNTRLPSGVAKPNQKENTVDSINYLRSVALSYVIRELGLENNTLVKKVLDLVSTMAYPLLNNGQSPPYDPAGPPVKIYRQRASDKLIEKRSYLQDLVKDYVVETFGRNFLTPDKLDKCRRDVGYMVDAIANDILTGVDAKSIQYALSYWDGNNTRIPDQIDAIISSIGFLNDRSYDILWENRIRDLSSNIYELSYDDTNSYEWWKAKNCTQANSATWEKYRTTYTTVNSNSSFWGKNIQVYTSCSPVSANWNQMYRTYEANIDNWQDLDVQSLLYINRTQENTAQKTFSAIQLRPENYSNINWDLSTGQIAFFITTSSANFSGFYGGKRGGHYNLIMVTDATCFSSLSVAFNPENFKIKDTNTFSTTGVYLRKFEFIYNGKHLIGKSFIYDVNPLERDIYYSGDGIILFENNIRSNPVTLDVGEGIGRRFGDGSGLIINGSTAPYESGDGITIIASEYNRDFIFAFTAQDATSAIFPYYETSIDRIDIVNPDLTATNIETTDSFIELPRCGSFGAIEIRTKAYGYISQMIINDVFVNDFVFREGGYTKNETGHTIYMNPNYDSPRAQSYFVKFARSAPTLPTLSSNIVLWLDAMDFSTVGFNTYTGYSHITGLSSKFTQNLAFSSLSSDNIIYNTSPKQSFNYNNFATATFKSQETNMPLNADWSSVAYGANKFVAVMRKVASPTTFSSLTAAYSLNGMNWFKVRLTDEKDWSSITYGNNIFVAVALPTVTTDATSGAYSNDGLVWNEMKMPESRNWINVSCGGGKFIAMAQFSLSGAYSVDGIDWYDFKLPASRNWQSSVYGNGRYVAIASNSRLGAYSLNGIDWEEMELPYNNTFNWKSLTFGEGIFVAVATNALSGAYSTNGINWNEIKLPATRDWETITYGDDEFFAIASNSDYAAYSDNGIDWNEVRLPANRLWKSIVYGDRRFSAISNQTDKGALIEELYYTHSSRLILSGRNTSATTFTVVTPTVSSEYIEWIWSNNGYGIFKIPNTYSLGIGLLTSFYTYNYGRENVQKPHCIAIKYVANTKSQAVYINADGSLRSINALSANFENGLTTIGGLTPLTGYGNFKLHELIFFNAIKPDAQIIQINNYLLDKWKFI
jgi:hypothetical protein